MKKLSTIAIAISALLFLSAVANAQNSSSRNMERRDQNDEYNRDNDDDQYNQSNDQYTQPYWVFNGHRPGVTVVFSTNGNRGNRRYNDYRRYNDDRKHESFHRHEEYHRNNDYNNGCEAPQRYGY